MIRERVELGTAAVCFRCGDRSVNMGDALGIGFIE